jgi:hypothetical protein
MSTKDTLFMFLSVFLFIFGMIVFSGRLDRDGWLNVGSFMVVLSIVFCFFIDESKSGAWMLDKYVFERLEHMDPFWAKERIIASVLILIACLVTLVMTVISPEKYLAAIAVGCSVLCIFFCSRALMVNST